MIVFLHDHLCVCFGKIRDGKQKGGPDAYNGT